VFVTPFPTPPPGTHVPPALMQRQAVRCVLPLGLSVLGEPYMLTGAGDAIRAYDFADADVPVLLTEAHAHAHDVTKKKRAIFSTRARARRHNLF
jgi:hypothetical protein